MRRQTEEGVEEARPGGSADSRRGLRVSDQERDGCRERRWPYPHQRTTLLESFNFAFHGFVYVLRHQRNMRIHFGLAALVLIASLFFQLSRLELLAVFIAITFVMVTELLNTAVETTVDILVSSYDRRVKIAKDVAAAAVLVSAINALVVAYLVFAERLGEHLPQVLHLVRRSPAYLTFIALVLVILLLIFLKATLGRGKPLAGGLPSGHAAIVFGGWTAVTFVVASNPHGTLVSAIALFMALLTAQSRVRARIHRTGEVVLGGVLGMLVVILIFQLWY